MTALVVSMPRKEIRPYTAVTAGGSDITTLDFSSPRIRFINTPPFTIFLKKYIKIKCTCILHNLY